MYLKVVLAYSGGLDTSVILMLLQEKLKAEVITVTVDVGQEKDFKEIAHKAEKLGSVKHYTIDAKHEFIERFVLPALKADALYGGKYPLSSALSRPLIAEKLVTIAKREGAEVIAHGCTGKGNDQIRFELTIKALDPTLRVIAPVRDWGLTRDWEIKYALSKGIPVKTKPYSIDENLWGRSIECGILEDPYVEPPEEVFKWTTAPEKAPNEPEYITIEFKEGIPTAINDEYMDPYKAITLLNYKAGKHGVGRIDHIEDRTIGIKSREVYECPAAVTLIEAHKDLEKLVLTKWELQFKNLADEIWSWLVYTGLWIEPLRKELQIVIDEMNKRVNGVVKVKLYKGTAIVVGRNSPNSLYDIKVSTYEAWSTYDQKLAKGFIELWGLQSVTAFNKFMTKTSGDFYDTLS